MEAVGSLAGGIAHDFNNMLSVILNYTDFALDDLPMSDPLRNHLLQVKTAVHHATLLTHKLLAFSRKQTIQPVPLNLSRIAEEIGPILLRVLGEDIQIVQRLAPDLGLIRAEPGQMEQVLMNLAINARDAMPKGGCLTIETTLVNVDEKTAARRVYMHPGFYIVLSVTDTGCGMDKKTRDRIFEPLFTTKGIGKGTGLGLSTVAGIVKQCGGDIRVFSKPGLGTAFKIYLPRHLATAAAQLITPR
jgi:signal transduction histidine kinase